MSTRKTREEIIDYIAYQLRSGDYTKKQLDSLSEALNVIGQAGGEHTGIVVMKNATGAEIVAVRKICEMLGISATFNSCVSSSPYEAVKPKNSR